MHLSVSGCETVMKEDDQAVYQFKPAVPYRMRSHRENKMETNSSTEGMKEEFLVAFDEYRYPFDKMPSP